MTSVEQNLQLSSGGMSTLCKGGQGNAIMSMFLHSEKFPNSQGKKTAIDPKPRVVKLTLLLQMSH